MFRKLMTVLMVMSLCLTTVACGGEQQAKQINTPNQVPVTSSNRVTTTLPDGKYPVQQGTFNDADGEYRLFLLNSNPPMFQTTDLMMARLTDEEIKAGEKSYLKVENGQKSLHITEDFKIEYVHAVTETRTNPQTGQPQTVVVRQESSFWTPFAGALAGQMVGSMLFTPRYYVPPVYQPGVALVGYGGYGRTYDQAVDNYRTRYQSAPIVERNRTQFRTTGRINNPSTTSRPSTYSPSNKSTGSGFGTSTLRQSGSAGSTNQKRSTGFGSSNSSRSGSSRPASSRRR